MKVWECAGPVTLSQQWGESLASLGCQQKVLERAIADHKWRLPRMGVPQIIQSLDLFGMVTWGILGIHHFKKTPNGMIHWGRALEKALRKTNECPEGSKSTRDAAVETISESLLFRVIFLFNVFLLKTYPKVWWFIIVIFPLHGSCLRSRPFSETSIRAISFFNIAARRLKSLVASLEQLHHHRAEVFAFFFRETKGCFHCAWPQKNPRGVLIDVWRPLKLFMWAGMEEVQLAWNQHVSV